MLGVLTVVCLAGPAVASEDPFLFPQIKRTEALSPARINAIRRFDAALDREQAVGPRQRALNENLANFVIDNKGPYAKYATMHDYLAPLLMVPVGDKNEDRDLAYLDRLIVMSDDLRKTAYVDRPFTDDWIAEQLRVVNRIGGKPDLDFKVAVLLNSLAYTQKIDGRLTGAIACFKRALDILQSKGDAHRDLMSAIAYDIGECYFWRGNTTQALHYMQCAMEWGPDIGKATMMSRICINAGRGHEAREILLRYKSLLPLDDLLKPDLQKAASQKQYADRVDSVLQEYADASIATNDYDEALAADEVLIELRAMRKDAAGVMGAIWQAAYVEQCMGGAEGKANRGAVVRYSRLIDEYGARDAHRPRPLADWLLARAQLHDLLGSEKDATRDFRLARVLYKRAYRQTALPERELESFERLGWTIDDIDYNLASRKKSPVSGDDYLHAEPVYRFDLAKTPVLKVYVDDTRAHGFAGGLRDLVLQNIRRWSDFEGSPIQLQFVDAVDEAQIYVERVMSYEDIPYSSAGRTTASYVEGRPDLLFRTHIKVFCRESGLESEAEAEGAAAGAAAGAGAAVGAGSGSQSVRKMSRFAREALATLVAHEFGHALGLGHSPGGLDMMYWKTQSSDLSLRDRNTIKKLYGAEKRP